MAVGWKVVSNILAVGVALMLVFAGLDFFLSRWLFTRDHMMSLTEMKKENKEDSGDPHIRSARNQERKKAAESAGLTGTNAMGIVFAGPGIAVGVTYKPERSGVPLIAVKRGDQAAVAELLKIAREKGVPIVEDPATTAALVKGRVGDAIPRDTFTPVAQALVKNGVTG
jgi:type III secretion protein U